MRILITGANGFVGRSTCAALLAAGHEVVAQQRSPVRDTNVRRPGLTMLQAALDERMEQDAPLMAQLRACDAIVHTAARVHLLQDTAADPLAAFRATNTALTLRLARLAVAAGVRRLVFVSTVKVNGERTAAGQAFGPDDIPAPADPYAVSKLEAEEGLLALAPQTGLEVVIVRPPLVYGPGVKANFERLMTAVWRGLPLPLGGIHNRRSLVGVDNLASCLERCATHPSAAGQRFIVSDGDDVSTPELLRAMGRALGRPARLLPVPPALLATGLRWLGRGETAQRLCASLAVDSRKLQERLDWSAPHSLEAGLQVTARAFLAERATGASR